MPPLRPRATIRAAAHLVCIALSIAVLAAAGEVPHGQAASAPADPIDAAVALGDFDRAVLLARLRRSPAKRCEVLLRKAAMLRAAEPEHARATLEAVVDFTRRYRGIPQAERRLSRFEQAADRRLAEMDLAEARGVEEVVKAADALLPLLPQTDRPATAVGTAMRLDGLGARDRARGYFRRATGDTAASLVGRTAALAGRLLEEGPTVSIAEVETLLPDLAAKGNEKLLGYVLALAAERAWQSTASHDATAMRGLLDRYGARLTTKASHASRARLAVHRIALARRDQVPASPSALADAEAAHDWLTSHGMSRDLADAALVAASLTPPGPVRERWLDEAAEAYASLDSVDAETSAAGLRRVAALRPARSDALAAQFESGQARPDPLIEDTTGFYRRVREAYELRAAGAFERGAFDEAFQLAQRAKLVELGPSRTRYETLGYDAVARQYVLKPETLRGPTVDLVVEYLVGTSATYIFGLRADEKRQAFERIHAIVPLGREALSRRVLDFLAAPDKGDAGRALADLLLHDAWGGWSRPWIVVSSDGPLRFLPFGLLPVPGGGTEGETILRRITVDRVAIQAHLEKRGALLTARRPPPRKVEQARRMGLWPEVKGRLAYLPTAAVLGNEPLASRETALSLWARSAARFRSSVKPGHPLYEKLSASSPVSLNTTSQGLVLSLWNEAGREALDSPSGRYLREVFSLASTDFGVNNKEGSILAQLRRDLSDGFRVVKRGRNATDVDLEAASPANDWGRWVYVDLAPVKRPR